jgi:hypothetical protein
MAAPAIDISKPNAANVFNTDLDAIRDNVIWLMIAAASCGYRLPGWSSVPAGADLSKPDSITMTKNSTSIKMKWTFTYSGDNLTVELWQYDKALGAGFETLTHGTVTHTYSGLNWSGATSA